MDKKQTNNQEEIEKALAELSEDEREFVDTLILSDAVYDIVVSQLNIPEDDEFYRSLVAGMLKRQTKDHLIFAIWNNLNEEQSRHLRDFINQASALAPWMAHEDVLMEFAMRYPDLMQKIYKSLSEFFKNFIEKFNEIAAA